MPALYDGQHIIRGLLHFWGSFPVSIVLNHEFWVFLAIFLLFYLPCQASIYCLPSFSGAKSALDFVMSLFFTSFGAGVLSRYFNTWNAVATALGRISDLQTQLISWFPLRDAYDILRWACCVVYFSFAEASGNPISTASIRYRKLMTSEELESIEKVIDKGLPPSYWIICWMQERVARLRDKGVIIDLVFILVSGEIREIRRNAACVGDFEAVQHPYFEFNIWNWMSLLWLLVLAMDSSTSDLGPLEFVIFLILITSLRRYYGDLSHPLRAGHGTCFGLNKTNVTSLDPFSIVYGKISSVLNWLVVAQDDLYMSKEFSAPWGPDYVALNPTLLDELRATLRRHRARHIPCHGSNHFCSWCSCPNELVDDRQLFSIRMLKSSWRPDYSTSRFAKDSREPTLKMQYKDEEEKAKVAGMRTKDVSNLRTKAKALIRGPDISSKEDIDPPPASSDPQSGKYTVGPNGHLYGPPPPPPPPRLESTGIYPCYDVYEGPYGPAP